MANPQNQNSLVICTSGFSLWAYQSLQANDRSWF